MGKKDDVSVLTQRLLQSIVILSLVGMLIFAVTFAARAAGVDNSEDIHPLASFILGFEEQGPLMVILLGVIGALTGVIPSYPLTMLSGAIWGTFEGSFYVLIGIQTGATLSFLIARFSLFPWVDALLRKQIHFYNRIDDKYITRFVFISRLLPFFVFELISYAAGLTRIKFVHYFWATLLGSIPITIFLAWSGKVVLEESGGLLVLLTITSIILLIAFPWIVEKYNPFNLKAKLFSNSDDAQQMQIKGISDRTK